MAGAASGRAPRTSRSGSPSDVLQRYYHVVVSRSWTASPTLTSRCSSSLRGGATRPDTGHERDGRLRLPARRIRGLQRPFRRGPSRPDRPGQAGRHAADHDVALCPAMLERRHVEREIVASDRRSYRLRLTTSGLAPMPRRATPSPKRTSVHGGPRRGSGTGHRCPGVDRSGGRSGDGGTRRGQRGGDGVILLRRPAAGRWPTVAVSLSLVMSACGASIAPSRNGPVHFGHAASPVIASP